MSNFDITNEYIVNTLLNIYDKAMVLKLYVDSNDENLKHKYLEAAHSHNNKLLNNLEHIDAGFDLFAPGNEGEEFDIYGPNLRFFGPGWQDAGPINKLDFKVCCSARMFTDTGKNFNTGYYMYPRSSLSKTKLRLANSTGIIDPSYRGTLKICLTKVDDSIPDLKLPCKIAQLIIDRSIHYNLEEASCIEDLGITNRGEGGFGSTDKK